MKDATGPQESSRKSTNDKRVHANNTMYITNDRDTAVPVLPVERILQSNCFVDGVAAVASYDGGSEVSLVTKRLVEQLGLKVNPTGISCNTVDRRSMKHHGHTMVNVVINQKACPTEALIVDTAPSDVLLGRPWLKQYGAKVDHEAGVVTIGRMKIQCSEPSEAGEPSVAAVSERVRLPPNSVVAVPFKLATPCRDGQVFDVKTDSVGGDLAIVPIPVIPNADGVALVHVVNLTPGNVSARGLQAVLVPQSSQAERPREPVSESQICVTAGHVAISANTKVGKDEFQRKLPENETEEDIMKIVDSIRIGKCTEQVRRKLREILRRFHYVFSRHKWDIGRLKDPKYTYSVKLKPGTVPRNFGHYRVAQAELAIVRKFVQRMKDAGLCDESSSPWAFPLMLIAKKDDPNERRPVINARGLNLVQETSATFLPKIDDLLDQFHPKNCVISKFDMTQFYFQIPLSEESRDICSFSTPIGNFRSNVMLQGDANAPHHAQKTLMDILRSIPSAFCLIDDVGLADETVEKHLANIEEVLARLAEAGLTLRPDKVELMVESLEYVGFRLSSGGRMEITDEKVSAVASWVRPRSLAELRSFLGFASFLRRFVRGFSELAGPMMALLKKDKWSEDDWTPKVDESFRALKKALTTAPCLTVPSPGGGTYHLWADSSLTSLGYVLGQEVFDEKLKKKVVKPCLFGSRLFRGAEKSYSIGEKEALACTYSIKKLRPYLFGSTFRLHTDSAATYHALKRTSHADGSARLARFAFDVLDMHFHVHHCKSAKNWADGLSRLPVVKGPDGELQYRQDDEEVLLDPNPPPTPPADVEIDPLMVGAVTRQHALDLEVGPDFKVEQGKDKEIQKIAREIHESPEKKVRRGTIVYKSERGIVFAVDKKRRVRYFVPKSLVNHVIKSEHTDAHLGQSKTLTAVTKRFYWVGQAADVADYVRGCWVCQTRKRQTPPAYAPLQDLPRPTRGMEAGALDIKGPFPPSNNMRYVIVLVDLFSRYAWTKAVPAVDGTAVIDFLIDVFQKFGRMSQLVTDNAANLKEGVAGYMYPHLGLEYLNSLAYFPSSNGAVERVIGTLGKMIRCASEDNAKWSKVVQYVTAIYNGSVHRATNLPPQLLHMGYEARPLPELSSEAPAHAVGRPEAYLLELQEQRAAAEKAVLDGLRSYYDNMQLHYNLSRDAVPSTFRVGQWVLAKILRPTDTKALGPLYEGPAEIVKVTKSSATIVFINSGIQATRSVSQLKPYYEARGQPTAEEQYTGPKRGDVQIEDADEGDGDEVTGPGEGHGNVEDGAHDQRAVVEAADNGPGEDERGNVADGAQDERGNVADGAQNQGSVDEVADERGNVADGAQNQSSVDEVADDGPEKRPEEEENEGESERPPSGPGKSVRFLLPEEEEEASNE